MMLCLGVKNGSSDFFESLIRANHSDRGLATRFGLPDQHFIGTMSLEPIVAACIIFATIKNNCLIWVELAFRALIPAKRRIFHTESLTSNRDQCRDDQRVENDS